MATYIISLRIDMDVHDALVRLGRELRASSKGKLVPQIPATGRFEDAVDQDLDVAFRYLLELQRAEAHLPRRCWHACTHLLERECSGPCWKAGGYRRGPPVHKPGRSRARARAMFLKEAR